MGMEVDVHSCQSGKPFTMDKTQAIILSTFLVIFLMVAAGTITEYYCLVHDRPIDKLDKDTSRFFPLDVITVSNDDLQSP